MFLFFVDLFGCCAGGPLNQLGMQQMRADIYVAELIEQSKEGTSADIGPVLADGA